jgi:hypothetical protein
LRENEFACYGFVINNYHITVRRLYLVLLLSIAWMASANALPVTTFSTNTAGGFDAWIYPTLSDGTFSLQSGIYTLPYAVNPGYVIILDDPALGVKDTSNWSDVIRFINNGSGKAFTMQMFVGGPDQASYFPSLSKVMNSSHVFITESGATNGGFTDFTDYSVTGVKPRNYHFFTGVFAVPDSGSTMLLLAIATGFLFMIHTVVKKGARGGLLRKTAIRIVVTNR